MAESLVSVMEYSDYRSFLKDRFQHSRMRNRRFSVAAWSKRLGLSAPSAMRMILNGQRNPGPQLLEVLVSDLGLHGRDAAFFKDLVGLEKCQSGAPERALKMARLAELHPRRQFRSVDAKSFRVISNWYYYVLRELVDLPDFREDPHWIKKRLRVELSVREIQEALRTLEEIGLLTRDTKGKLKYPGQVQTAFDIPDEGLKAYHEQILAFARDSIRSVPVEQREISGIAVTLNQQDLPRVKEILRRAQEEIALLGNRPGTDVYQLEMAFFPFTKSTGTKR